MLGSSDRSTEVASSVDVVSAAAAAAAAAYLTPLDVEWQTRPYERRTDG
jgi:hypothetical protein